MKIGDIVKVDGINKIFRIKGLSSGSKTIPDGWLIDVYGFNHNPDKCHKYTGATSVLTYDADFLAWDCAKV